jgi:hypothetical protein
MAEGAMPPLASAIKELRAEHLNAWRRDGGHQVAINMVAKSAGVV